MYYELLWKYNVKVKVIFEWGLSHPIEHRKTEDWRLKNEGEESRKVNAHKIHGMVDMYTVYTKLALVYYGF